MDAGPPPPRGRRTLPAWLAAAALTAVLAAVLVVGTAGGLAVLLLGRGGQPVPGTVAAAAEPTTPQPLPDTAADRAALGGPAAPPPAPVDAAGVLAAVDAAAATAGGSIAVVVTAADGTPLVTSPSAGDVVYTASLVKLFAVGRLLSLEASGALVLTDADRSLMERAVVRSDDTAMSLLWDRFDGVALVAAVTATGLTATGPADVPGQWGEGTTSAADVARVLVTREATFGAGPAATLLGWMRATTVTGADGFGQHFGLLAGADGSVAAKQGWMCCVGGTRQLHSAGVLPGGQVVVLLGDFPAATSWARARAAIDGAAAAVRAALD